LLAEAEQDMNMCLLTVLPSALNIDEKNSDDYLDKVKFQRHAILEKFIHYAVNRNVPMYTKMISDVTMANGIMNEIKNDDNVKLLLMKWPDQKKNAESYHNTLLKIIKDSKANLGVLKDRGIKSVHNILVPVGGGLNSRMAIHLANDIAIQEGSYVTYVRVIPRQSDKETDEDLISHLQEIVMTQLGNIPPNATLRISHDPSVQHAVLEECEVNEYELIIIGSADNPTDGTLFGRVCEDIVTNVPYSVLVVYRHESATSSWLRQQAKHLQRD